MPTLNTTNNLGILPEKEDENQMLPHQQRLVDKLRYNSTLALHSPGSGKTRSSIEAYKSLGRPQTLAVVPAALQTNYRNELKKWLKPGEADNFNIVSQQLIARNGLNGYDAPFMILDESQKSKDTESKLFKALQASKAKKKLFLSATPNPNGPVELAGSINFLAGKKLLPTNKQDFYNKYVDYEKVSPGIIPRLLGIKPGVVPKLKNTAELKHILKKYVDFYQAPQKGFPTTKEEIVKVPMAPNQDALYKTLLGKGTWAQRYRVRHELPPEKNSLNSMRAFLSGQRQISDSNFSFIKNKRLQEAPKAEAAFKYFYDKYKQDKNYKAFVYSAFLQSGLTPYENLLKSKNIPYGRFTGLEDKKVRDQNIKDFNENRLNVLLGSGSSAEGISLLGTRLTQLLDPSWNLDKSKQIASRSSRYHSHSHLPKEKQNVLIQHYLSEPRGSWFDRILGKATVPGSDEYMYNLSKQKQLLNDQLTALLKNP